jgi:hypothetical protein
MPSSSPANNGKDKLATREDIESILGEIDTETLLAIVELRPTIAGVETAFLWLDGDPDVFGSGEPLKGAASEIVTLLTENEEEEPPHAG